MQITRIQNSLNNKNLTFGRRPKKEEEADYQKTIENGFKAAGVDQRIAITHGSVFPAAGRDSFIGSPYGEGAKAWIQFLKLNGFNGNQLGPNGSLSQKEYSPYNASALNENPLFIDLAPLTSEKYGKILSKETYENITIPAKTNDKNYRFSDFTEAKFTYYLALHESYKNFKTNLAKGQPEAIKLNQEFNDYKNSSITEFITKGKQTEEEGMFKALATLYRTENYDKWENPLDKNLMSEVRKDNPKAIKRYESLKQRFKAPIEEYQFEQFIVNKQIKENKDFRDGLGFKYFSDLLIGCSKMDAWRYKEAFLEGYAMGSSEQGDTPYQTWGVPVLNPRKLFVGADGLNIGGQFLKEKLQHALENCENIRIDHAMGLIEPFVYEEDTVKYNKAGKQIKEDIHANFMSQLTDSEGVPYDTHYDYPRILERLVLPTLKENGLSKNDPVWEDICCEPDLFKKIYRKEHDLPKLLQLDSEKHDNSGTKHWYLIGSHDSVPVENMLRQHNGWRRDKEAWKPEHLGGYLFQDPARKTEKEEFSKLISGYIDGIVKSPEELKKADKALIKAKFAELFTKEKVQVSFADILGMTDKNLVYNVGGGKHNIYWKERMSPDFIDKYYENLSSDNPTALNIPEVLKMAVEAKIDMNLATFTNQVKDDPDKENKINQKRNELHEVNQPLLDKLEYYANILKEKEE